MSVRSHVKPTAAGLHSPDSTVYGITLAQELADVSTCSALHTSGDGAVTVDELVVARTNLPLGCSAD